MADVTESQDVEPGAEQDADGGTQPLDALLQAVKIAAAGAAVGAAAAAARALTSHDEKQADEEDEAENESAVDEAVEEPQAEAPEEPEPDPEPEPEPDEAEDRGVEDQPENREDEEPVQGASASDAKEAVDRARQQLEELLERQVESLSGLERTHDGWLATFEVLELSRIPESTDILASYEIELDDDRNLRRYQQVRRYHRSQVEQGQGA